LLRPDRRPAGSRTMSLSVNDRPEQPRVVARPPESALRRFLTRNRAAMGTFAVLAVMILIFMIASPRVFLNWTIYSSVLVTLPVALALVVPLVFVVTVGEIDLSFPSTMGFSAWMFALLIKAGFPAVVAIAAAIVTGTIIGLAVGSLVVY